MWKYTQLSDCFCAGVQRHLQEELDEAEELCHGEVSQRHHGGAKGDRGWKDF